MLPASQDLPEEDFRRYLLFIDIWYIEKQ